MILLLHEFPGKENETRVVPTASRGRREDMCPFLYTVLYKVDIKSPPGRQVVVIA